uniref:hypothetical protein n=1 Tax=Candidatus Enterovibrio escicola TaxID=1927127 RepID=UPI001CC2399C|nr:hypothetical protein [Candidatus Enterovibrio escacola]
MTIVIVFHQSGYQNLKPRYIDFVYCYLTHRQELPSLIRPSYRFVVTSTFLDIRFLKV